MDRRYFFNHVSNLIGVGNHNLFCLFASQIGKFLQHLFCGTKIKRCLIIRIRKSVSRHDNAPVNLVLRIHKMNVAGCHYRLFKLLAQLYDFFVQLNQVCL